MQIVEEEPETKSNLSQANSKKVMNDSDKKRKQENKNPRTKKKSLSKSTSRLAYFLIIPAILLELLIHIIPMFLGVYIAFISLNQLSLSNWISAPFVGLQNFINGLNPNGTIGQQYFSTLLRTLIYTVIVVGSSWCLGMLGAYFLNGNVKGRAFFRTFFLFPYALPAFVTTIAWKFMLSQRDGAVNQFLVDTLGLFGEDRPFWLLGNNSFISIIVVGIWQTWPFAFLMLLASLQTISPEIYEAAALDGASRWKQFTKLTLPMIKPSNAVLILVLCLWTFNQFNVPFILFGDSSPKEALLMSPLIYQNSFKAWNFGLGGAMSVLLLLALLVASVIYIRLVMPKKGESND